MAASYHMRASLVSPLVRWLWAVVRMDDTGRSDGISCGVMAALVAMRLAATATLQIRRAIASVLLLDISASSLVGCRVVRRIRWRIERPPLGKAGETGESEAKRSVDVQGPLGWSCYGQEAKR